MCERLQQIVGRNVRIERERQGLTKVELSLMAGVSRQYLDHVEAGKANLSLRMVDKLANALDTPAFELLRELS